MSNFFEENQIRLIDLALGSWKNNNNNNSGDSQGINPNPNNSNSISNNQGENSFSTMVTSSIPAAPFHTSWWKPLSEELIKDGLEMILDAKNYPIIVMDT